MDDNELIVTKKVSKSVRISMDSAWSAYNDAKAFPSSSEYNASRLFFYITSWEHAQRAYLKWGVERNNANKHLSHVRNYIFTVDIEGTEPVSYTSNELEKKLDKDHRVKLDYAPPIRYFGRLEWIKKEYLGPADLHDLRKLTLYGRPNVIDRKGLFANGWDVKEFMEALIAKLEIQTSMMDFADTNIGK